MTPLEAFRLHKHLKLHFTGDKYDVRKYIMASASEAAFQASKSRFKIEALSKKYTTEHLKEYFIANFVAGDKNGGVFNADGGEVLLEWRRRTQGLTYLLKQDLQVLVDALEEKGQPVELNALWGVKNGHPLLVTNFLGKRISLETLVILNEYVDFQSILNEKLKGDFVWAPISRMITKYQPFCEFRKPAYMEIIRKMFAV